MLTEKEQTTERQAMRKLSALCAKAEHCRGEIARKARMMGLDEEAQERILAQLMAGKYIDDERYTRAFVNDKIAYNKWGRRKIEQALYLKGVSNDIACKVLDEVPDEDYIDILRPLIKNKWKNINARNDYERSMKLIKYALGRGFEMHLIRQCIDHADDLMDD